MIYRCECDLHSNFMVEALEHVAANVLGVVDHDVLRNVVMIDNVLQMNFLIVAEVMLVKGFASTHFMKYSTATMAKV
jgi:hypothetical protein